MRTKAITEGPKEAIKPEKNEADDSPDEAETGIRRLVDKLQESIRLKHQGAAIYGTFDLSAIPEPTPDDFVAYVQVFYPWLRTIIDQRPAQYRTLDATVNTVLYELRLWLWDRTAEHVLDKRQVIDRLLDLAGEASFAEDLARLRKYLVSGGSAVALEEAEGTLKAVTHFVRQEVPWSVA